MLGVINDLGELKNYIKGIHLNCSLSGDYVLEQIMKYRKSGFAVEELTEEVYGHILNIDRHKPFNEKYVKELVDFVNLLKKHNCQIILAN